MHGGAAANAAPFNAARGYSLPASHNDSAGQ